MFAGNFEPVGWAFCNGQLLLISENDTLFTLIGTTYGGDGQETFALPDLRGRIPLHAGSGLQMGEQGGQETVTLSLNQIPAHTHAMVAGDVTGNTSLPEGSMLAKSTSSTPYATDTPTISLSPSSLQPSGGSQPHENLQPYLCVNFIISLYGVFPT